MWYAEMRNTEKRSIYQKCNNKKVVNSGSADNNMNLLNLLWTTKFSEIMSSNGKSIQNTFVNQKYKKILR